MPCSFAALTRITGTYILCDIVIHLGPMEVCAYPTNGLICSEVSRSVRVMFSLHDFLPQSLILRYVPPILVQEQVFLNGEVGVYGSFRGANCRHYLQVLLIPSDYRLKNR